MRSRTRSRMSAPRPAVAALALAGLTLAGCGEATGQAGDGVASAGTPAAATTPGGSASPAAPADREEAALKFAQCMREHGVDMPDPIDGRIRITRREGEEAKTERALKECEHLMQQGVRDGRGPIDQQRYDEMVKYAQCMREHGIDMPDPRPGEPIRLHIRKDQEAKAAEAQKACRHLAPGLGEGP